MIYLNPFLRRLLIVPKDSLSSKFRVEHDARAGKSSCKLCRIVFYYPKGLLIFVLSVSAFCSHQDRLFQAELLGDTGIAFKSCIFEVMFD